MIYHVPKTNWNWRRYKWLCVLVRNMTPLHHYTHNIWQKNDNEVTLILLETRLEKLSNDILHAPNGAPYQIVVASWVEKSNDYRATRPCHFLHARVTLISSCSSLFSYITFYGYRSTCPCHFWNLFYLFNNGGESIVHTF